jgi:hypothetical protein
MYGAYEMEHWWNLLTRVNQSTWTKAYLNPFCPAQGVVWTAGGSYLSVGNEMLVNYFLSCGTSSVSMSLVWLRYCL